MTTNANTDHATCFLIAQIRWAVLPAPVSQDIGAMVFNVKVSVTNDSAIPIPDCDY